MYKKKHILVLNKRFEIRLEQNKKLEIKVRT
jgi:hypothetical protein